MSIYYCKLFIAQRLKAPKPYYLLLLSGIVIGLSYIRLFIFSLSSEPLLMKRNRDEVLVISPTHVFSTISGTNVLEGSALCVPQAPGSYAIAFIPAFYDKCYDYE